MQACCDLNSAERPYIATMSTPFLRVTRREELNLALVIIGAVLLMVFPSLFLPFCHSQLLRRLGAWALVGYLYGLALVIAFVVCAKLLIAALPSLVQVFRWADNRVFNRSLTLFHIGRLNPNIFRSMADMEMPLLDVTILRSEGDEASMALATAQFASWIADRVWNFATFRQTRALLPLSLGVLLILNAWPLYDSLWISRTSALWIEYIGAILVCAPGWACVAGICLLAAAQMTLAIAFGREALWGAWAFRMTAEETPIGAWKIVRSEALSRERLRHSSYEHPGTIDLLVTSLLERLERQRSSER